MIAGWTEMATNNSPHNRQEIEFIGMPHFNAAKPQPL
jgi:hypothetical protein